jgi:hypothetical protein
MWNILVGRLHLGYASPCCRSTPHSPCGFLSYLKKNVNVSRACHSKSENCKRNIISHTSVHVRETGIVSRCVGSQLSPPEQQPM